MMIKVNRSIINTTTNLDVSLMNSETYGAMIYIIVVIFWYSIGLVFLLSMEILGHKEEIEDSARRRTGNLIRNLRDHTITKEILEELLDKKNRGRLWNIYLGAKWSTKDCLTRAEKTRIRHIEKQLALIERDHHLTHEIIDSTVNNIHFVPNRSNYQSNSSRLITQQNLIHWKELPNLSKPYEFISSTNRKSLKRNKKKLFTFKRSNTTYLSGNIQQTESNSFLNQSSKILRHRTEIDLSTLISANTIADRQNPYLSYFHLSLLDTLNFQ